MDFFFYFIDYLTLELQLDARDDFKQATAHCNCCCT
jgi:hypothetical protein